MHFRPEQHVRRQSDFRDAREKGRRLDCGGFTLWYYQRPAAPEQPSEEAGCPPEGFVEKTRPVPKLAGFRGPRVGVIASTSAVGCAVERNRAKRRLREVFRLQQKLVPDHFDLLLVARHSLNRLEYRVIEQKFIDACRRVFPPRP